MVYLLVVSASLASAQDSIYVTFTNYKTNVVVHVIQTDVFYYDWQDAGTPVVGNPPFSMSCLAAFDVAPGSVVTRQAAIGRPDGGWVIPAQMPIRITFWESVGAQTNQLAFAGGTGWRSSPHADTLFSGVFTVGNPPKRHQFGMYVKTRGLDGAVGHRLYKVGLSSPIPAAQDN